MNRLPAYLFTPDREDEFEPPTVPEREDDECRCAECGVLIGCGEFCEVHEAEYRAATEEQARASARAALDGALYGVAEAICGRYVA